MAVEARRNRNIGEAACDFLCADCWHQGSHGLIRLNALVVSRVLCPHKASGYCLVLEGKGQGESDFARAEFQGLLWVMLWMLNFSQC